MADAAVDAPAAGGEYMSDDDYSYAAGTPPEGAEGAVEAEAASALDDETDSLFLDEEAGDVNPEHPLLARAQEALRKQLSEAKTRADEELREKGNLLKEAKKKREDVGVELYGVQQQLARAQMGLEKTQEKLADVASRRTEAEEDKAQLEEALTEVVGRRDEDRHAADALQKELDALAGTLKQIEAYNEQMKSEIAVTRRATYVAEESVAKAEKEKQEQDLLIDGLQEELKALHQRLALYEAQRVAQEQETRSARETLASADTEMESIHFEKKQLAQQWKSSLIAMARRDEALQATEEALSKQREQQQAIEQEIEGFRRQIRTEQEKNEQLTGVQRKVEAEAEYLTKTIAGIKERAAALQNEYGAFKKTLMRTEENGDKVKAEGAAIESDIATVDRSIVKANNEIKDLELKMLESLSEQTTVEKQSRATVQASRKARKAIADQQMVAVSMSNELAKIRVDVLNTQSHNERLNETLSSLDEELRAKSAQIEKYEQEIHRRTVEIEKKTNEVDRLNRQYEKLTANTEEEGGRSNGPLEATIVNLQREIGTKDQESAELQRRWVGFQTELVALVTKNNSLTERVARQKSERTVLEQRRARLDSKYAQNRREIHELERSMSAMHTDMTRLNTLISKNTSLQGQLTNDNFNLETSIVNSLKELEAEAVRTEARIEATRAEKRDLLNEIIETERQIMLWERKIELERETQAAIDPKVGNTAVAAMRKEIHRMQLRYTELQKISEKLMQDMERAIQKREIISTKGRAQANKKTGVLTQAALNKQLGELKRQVRQTEQEVGASEQRMEELEERRGHLAEMLEQAAAGTKDMREKDEAARRAQDDAQRQRAATLVATLHAQKAARRFEDLEAGRYAPSAPTNAQVVDRLRAEEQKATVLAQIVEGIAIDAPQVEAQLLRARCTAETILGAQ